MRLQKNIETEIEINIEILFKTDTKVEIEFKIKTEIETETEIDTKSPKVVCVTSKVSSDTNVLSFIPGKSHSVSLNLNQT